MTKRNTYKLFYSACAGVALLTLSQNASAFGFPTWDAGEVVNTINGYTTQIQTYTSQASELISVGNIQQAIGDSVGGMEKFQDAKKKVAKEKEKADKKMRELERKQKLAQKQMQQNLNEVNKVKNAVKSGVNEINNTYNTAKDLYDEGMSYYEEGKEMYETGQELRDTGEELFGSDNQENTFDEAEMLENADIADMVSDAAFSEGRWDESIEQADEELSGSDNQENASDEAEMLENADIADMLSDASFSEGRWDESIEQAEQIVGENAIEAEPLPTDKEVIARQPFVRQNAVEQAVSEKSSEAAEKQIQAVSEVVSDKDAPAAVTQPAAPAADTGIKMNLKRAVKPVATGMQPATTVRRKTFTTSEKNAFYQIETPMAFAQLGGGIKTGYTELGKFVFSDVIAMECGMGVEDVKEEKVAECVKTWVMGMTDPNAVVAAEWKKKFTQARHDHVSQDLAGALTQKSYAAAFQTEVAEDMEKKADATSNERDQISYNGKINQINQEIIIRLMEAMTSQLITDSLQSVERLDRSYYEQDGE